MQYRPLGHSGLNVSAIGFGAWAIGGSWGPQNDQDSLAALHQAIDHGVNLIDTAAGYGNGKSEQLIAQVLAERSEQVYVATKTPPLPGSWPPSPYDLAEERYPASYLRQNVEERLRNLRTDVLIHPEDLAALGFVDGDPARLASELGTMDCRLRAADIRRGVLQGYWPECNVVIGRRLDPRSEEPDYNAPVRILPARN